MSQGPLCPNLTKKVQKEVSQMANRNLPIAMLKIKDCVCKNLLDLTTKNFWTNYYTDKQINTLKSCLFYIVVQCYMPIILQNDVGSLLMLSTNSPCL